MSCTGVKINIKTPIWFWRVLNLTTTYFHCAPLHTITHDPQRLFRLREKPGSAPQTLSRPNSYLLLLESKSRKLCSLGCFPNHVVSMVRWDGGVTACLHTILQRACSVVPAWTILWCVLLNEPFTFERKPSFLSRGRLALSFSYCAW